MVDLTERIIRVEKQLEEVSKPEVQQRMTSDLNIARENVRKLKDRLDRLKAAEESGGGATAVGTVEIPGTVTPVRSYNRLSQKTTLFISACTHTLYRYESEVQ